MKIRFDVILDFGEDAIGEEVDRNICEIIDAMWDYATDVDVIRKEQID